MSGFKLNLRSGSLTETFDDVISFTGKGDDGQFGILANAERRVYSLSYGLARFQRENGEVEYLAFPGGVLYFRSNELSIATRSYIRSQDYQKISSILEMSIQEEDEHIGEIKRILHDIDQEVLKKLSEIGQEWNYD